MAFLCESKNWIGLKPEDWPIEKVILLFWTAEVASGTLLRARVSLPWRAELLLEAILRAGPGGAR
jgi:hypothetical protein